MEIINSSFLFQDLIASSQRDAVATLSTSVFPIEEEEIMPLVCLLNTADWKLFKNVWEGSEQSCNCINTEHGLKIQKLLTCLLVAVRDEVQLLSDTRAQGPCLAPKLLFSCSW